MLKKTLLTFAVIVFVGFSASSSAVAGTATGSFNVKITVLSTCNVSAAVGTNDINFGNQNANATANLDQAEGTPLTVACTTGTPYVINLTPQSNSSTTGAGYMSLNAVNIPYQLRQATGASAVVWGNTGTAANGAVVGNNGVTGVGTGMANAQPHTVYATVASTDVVPGTYTDTVNVSVLY